MGTRAGAAYSTSNRSTIIGSQAGSYSASHFLFTASDNTLLGASAGTNLRGSYNTLIGSGAGGSEAAGQGAPVNSGTYNTFNGYMAGYGNKSGSSNTSIGSNSGRANTLGSNNVMIGDSSGYNNIVSNNIFVGSKAGYANQTGQKSTFIGYQSGYNAVADSNTFVGYQSGYTTTTGKGNTFLGIASGRGNSTGSHNTFVGNGTGPTNTNSNDNVYIGYNTGQQNSGSHNTFVGTGADAIAQNLTNATALGAGTRVAISNAVVLGNQANVGIGTEAPAARLHVSSGKVNESGLRLSDLTTQSPATQSADAFLAVDDYGNVVKARYRLLINNTNEWSDNVFMPGYRLRPLREVARFINQYGHLPGIPSAVEMVEQGADLVKMNATLLQKIEELTLYSLQQQQEIDELKQLARQLMDKK